MTSKTNYELVKLISILKQLATDMKDTSKMMELYSRPNKEIHKHGEELYGAATLVDSWIEALSIELNEE